MVEAAVVFIIVGLIIVGILVNPMLIEQRRDRVKKRPFLPHWIALIEHHLPLYSRLSAAERKRLQGHIQVFLAEKQFIGCNGLQITEEIKLTIAAIACLLLLNERGQYFPRLRSILVYPSTYLAQSSTALGSYFLEEQKQARLGESWVNDQVVLSWEQVQQDIHQWQDGHNVVLHEFAHQLDQEDGTAKGVPILRSKLDYPIWAQVMTAAYQQLCRDAQSGTKTVMDYYGATSPAEFFAVATETFFEKPRQLLRQHPDLYQQLQHYYQLNPVQWV